MMKRLNYHIYCEYLTKSNERESFDGIITINSKDDYIADYDELKKMLRSRFIDIGVDINVNNDELIIKSMGRL